MATGQLNAVLCYLRRAVLPAEGNTSDGQLLQRFLATRDETAFEALLRRHGRMVLSVCRRILFNLADSEDAFQASFVVLVRKAATVAGHASLGGWLHGVAYRTALKARAARARQLAKEKQMARPEAVCDQGSPWSELRPIIDQELGRLPDKYREPIILCDLEGQTRKAAAQRLGWSEGTLSGRLARARVILAKRLARRGLALSAGAMAVTLAANAATAALPVPLVSSTVKAAVLVAAGHAVAGAFPASVAALTEGVLKTMSMSKVKLVFAVALAVSLAGAGWGVYQTRAADKAQVQSQPAGTIGSSAPIKMPANFNLPIHPPPTQILASIDGDGKLVIKHPIMTFVPVGPPAPPVKEPPAPPGAQGNAAPGNAIAKVKPAVELRAETYDLDKVQVFDNKGKKVTSKQVRQLLKKETLALASLWGQKVDPLHLRVLRDGILVFELPPPKGMPGFPGIAPPGIQPLPAPAILPPFGAGSAPSSTGIGQPPIVAPGPLSPPEGRP
jgi:RNA polymerase sigma factor (sigma-70 family)